MLGIPKELASSKAHGPFVNIGLHDSEHFTTLFLQQI